MSPSRKDAASTFILVLLYGLFFHALQFVFHQRDMVDLLPTGKLLMGWDVAWYRNIVDEGYKYHDGFNSNSAFFILFPFIWKLTQFGPWGISVLNILFYAIGLTVLTRLYRLSMADKLIWLTIPSFYFCFIPYTEALFFMLASVVLFAIARKRKYLLWTSLLLLSLVRPVSMILMVAFLAAELITTDRRDWLKAIGRFFMFYGWPLISGLVFFIWYQYYETGVWFAFFKQEKNWGHEFAWPTLPFNSMYGPKLLWLNAIAMFAGFLSMAYLIRKGIQWLFNNEVAKDKILVISYLYLTGILLVTILFNPIWVTSTTNVYDIHRYAMVSPFFLVFLYRHTQVLTYKGKDFLIILLLSNAFWLLFASYTHIQNLLYFNFNTAIVFLFMLYANKKLTWPPMVIAVLNFYIQVSMFQMFIDQIYPG